jgi:putative hydrolase of the HAD superfamily
MRLLDKFSVLLLDMNGTFVFGQDRFGEAEDFYATYRSVGGSRLRSLEVSRLILNCHKGMCADYADPRRQDDFPTLAEGFRRYAQPPEEELPFLLRVFALHEAGKTPDSFACLLRRLALTHRLGLVSNIWSPKDACLEEFERAGLGTVFQHKVFSSDFRSIKPSSVLFLEGLNGMNARPDEALFIGDSLLHDIEGAHRVGIATAWITARREPQPSVDYIMQTLEEIETHPG